MQKQVLFIQGAGKGAFKMDGHLVEYLQDSLGSKYEILYPEMPNESEPDYDAWIAKIDENLNSMKDELILVGHSVGGAILLKYLSEEGVQKVINSLHLIAPPYDESVLPKDDFSKIEKILSIFFYHSRDDDIVPFSHLANYAEKLPKATFRKLDGRGHQFDNDLSEVFEDIKGL